MIQPVVDEFVRSPIATLGGVAAIASVIIALVLARRDSKPPKQSAIAPPAKDAPDVGELSGPPFISYAAVISRSLLVLAAVCGFAMFADRIMDIVDWKVLAATILVYAVSVVVSAYLLSVLLTPWILQNYRTLRLKGGKRVGVVHNVPYAIFANGFAGVVVAINAGVFFVFCVESLFGLWWAIMGSPKFESGSFTSFHLLPFAYTVMTFGFLSIPIYYAVKFLFRTQLSYAATKYGSSSLEDLH